MRYRVDPIIGQFAIHNSVGEQVQLVHKRGIRTAIPDLGTL